MNRITASSRKTIAVAVVALAIALGALGISAVHAVTAPIYATGLYLAQMPSTVLKIL